MKTTANKNILITKYCKVIAGTAGMMKYSMTRATKSNLKNLGKI